MFTLYQYNYVTFLFAYFATNSTAFNFPPANVNAATTFLASAPVKTVSLCYKIKINTDQ